MHLSVSNFNLISKLSQFSAIVYYTSTKIPFFGAICDVSAYLFPQKNIGAGTELWDKFSEQHHHQDQKSHIFAFFVKIEGKYNAHFGWVYCAKSFACPNV